MTKSEPFFNQLQAKRKSQKINLSEISDRTKIGEKFLVAIEKGDFSKLPQVYLRLFIRSYATEIGADPDKVIEEFEIYTTGTVPNKILTPRPQNDSDKVTKNFNKSKTDKSYSLNRNQILIGLLTLAILITLFKFVGNLTKEIQETPKKDITTNLSDTVFNTIRNDTLNLPKNTLSNNITLLQESLFLNSNKLPNADDNIKLPIKPPFIFSVKAKENTLIHIRTTKNDSIINDQNIQLLQDSTIVVEFSDKLFFDIWKTHQVEVTINTKQVHEYFNHDNVAVRGSIISDGSCELKYFKY